MRESNGGRRLITGLTLWAAVTAAVVLGTFVVGCQSDSDGSPGEVEKDTLSPSSVSASSEPISTTSTEAAGSYPLQTQDSVPPMEQALVDGLALLAAKPMLADAFGSLPWVVGRR